MAQDLSAITPKILAKGLQALRLQCVMPQLVNFDWSVEAAQKGATIDIPVSAAIAVQDVTAANTPPVTADTTPTLVQVPLDQWKEAPFYMTDKDLLQASNDILPLQASEAVKAIAETVNAYIITQMAKGFYSQVYTSGTDPLGSDLSAIIAARKLMAKTAAPLNPRRFVISPEAEGNALGLTQFTNVQVSGSTAGLVEGTLGRKLGFDWYMDQQIGQSPCSAPLSAGAATCNGVNALGATTISIAKATGTHVLVEGDIFTKAGDTQQYVVCNSPNVTLIVGNTNVSIYPPLKVATTGGEAITLQPASKANLAFHRDAFAFASRPLRQTEFAEVPVHTMTMTDNVSGLSLRLEITREHKRYRWSFDCLYGGKVVRREFGARVSG